MKITHFLICSAILCAGGPARADEDTRAVQQHLKDDGFFFGTVDGTAGKETTDAIRRYQIRNGLDVSGKLDEATRKALQLGDGASGAAGSATEQPPVVTPPAPRPKLTAPAQPDRSTAEQDRDLIPPSAPRTPAAPPVQGAPDEEGSDAGSYARFFRKTPYEIAPPVVQRDTVRRAKARLAEAGYLRGPVDGRPTADLADALRAYQTRRDMAASGRLDMDTLSHLHLLPPVERAPAPRRGEYRGVWIN